MTVSIEYEAEKKLDLPYEKIIKEIVEASLDFEKCPYEAEVNVILTDNDAIQAINKEYRQIDAPTDVLSFPMVDYEKPSDFDHVEDAVEDYFNPEIVDPDTFEPVPDGQIGELVFTRYAKEAFPLIRYRTKDITYITREKCKCGRTHARIHRLMGRSDDMLIVKGVNVYPSQVEEVRIKQGMPANYQLIVDRVNNSDTMEVLVEMTPEMFSDKVSSIESKEKDIVTALKSMLGIYAKVKLVEPKSITRSEGKAVRVIDKRKI